MSASGEESAPRGTMQVVLRPVRDWDYAERHRRLQQVYRWLLDLEPWPVDAEEERPTSSA